MSSSVSDQLINLIITDTRMTHVQRHGLPISAKSVQDAYNCNTNMTNVDN